MAENAVGSLFQSLGRLLLEEGSLTLGLHEEIKGIKLEFESMQSFLKDADMRQHTPNQEGLRTWVEQVRNMAYEVEDIIDEYTYFMTKYHKQGLQGAIYNTISIPKKIFYQHRMAGKLKDIRAKLKFIGENRTRYALQSCEVTSNEARERLRMLGEASIYLPEDDLVGIERNRDSLISWLTNEKPERMVYSVVGMGGLGKTTLVAKAFQSSKVQNHFNCCAWVTVSQSFDPNKILQSMIKEFMGSSKPNNCDGMDYRELVKTLIGHLQSQSYVLILDDVWSTDAWKYIDVAIPNNMKGSRIMITTRDKEVASYVAGQESHVFNLQHLNENDAWTLFCRKAFKNNRNETCPIELQSSALNIVKKCDGLPLAIATTGSLMSSKQQDVAEWKYVEDCFGHVLNNHRFYGSAVKNVLLLSYYELPTRLKQCFLYLCAYPEDYTFCDWCITRIWAADGFVEKIEGQTLKDAAMDYINELVGRCMIQYVRRRFSIKYYRVHDVLREIGVSIAKDENFIINSIEEEPQYNRNARRLLIKVDREGDLLQLGTSNLRTYIVCGSLTSVIKNFHPTFKLLRVLDLEGAPLQEIPNSLGELFNLQYLNLSSLKISELPSFLRRLRNLRTLRMYYSKVKKIPSWIVKLKKMQVLNISCESDDEMVGVKAPTGICMLKSLEDLQYVEGNKELLKKIGNLTKLKCLGIESVNEEDGVDLCASLQRLKSLLILIINEYKEQGPLELEALSSPPPLLQFLVLNGKLKRLPNWIHSLKNLAELWLWNSNLSADGADPLSSLQLLLNLEKLFLYGTYDGNQLCFRAPFFPKLKTLRLHGLKNLDMIEIEDGVMSHLQCLSFENCLKLKTLPVGIEYLRQLKVLLFFHMPEEFTNRLGEGTGEDRSKIQHIEIIKDLHHEPMDLHFVW